MRGFVATLKATIKTHKDPGEVVPRALHTAPSHPFASLMRLISDELDGRMRGECHLLKDTFDLKRKLSGFRLPVGHKLIKIDVKDFFMSGTAKELIKHML